MKILEWHSIIFTALFVLIAAGFVTLLFSRSTYAKIRAIPYAFVYGIGVVIWLASLVYTQYVANTFLAHRFSFSAAYVFTLGMLGLALNFPNHPLSRTAIRLLGLDVLVGSVFIGLIFFTDDVLTATNFSGFRTAPFSLLGKIYLLLLAAHLAAAVAVFVRRYLTEVRNRLYFNYIVLSFIALFLIAITTNLILPLNGVVDFALLGPLSALLPFATVVYALGITDIDDISYMIAQLLQVGARLLIMVGLLVLGILLQRVFGVGYYSSAWVISMCVVAGVSIICFYLFGSAFDRYVENTVAYSRLSPDKARARLIAGLSGEIELDRNATLVLKLVKQAIGVRAAGIVLLAKDGIFWSSGELTLPQTDVPAILKVIAGLPAKRGGNRGLANVDHLPEATKHELEGQGIYAVKSLHMESGIAGLYLIGEKYSQEIFTRQDVILMNAITEIGDLSIERALFYSQIQSFNATLQERINDATQRLRTANKRLKTLDAMKDDFISMASHQLRSPAASVRDALDMLEQGFGTPKDRRKLIELAKISSERLVNVVTDMLSVARIQAGHFTLEKTSVEMVALVERAILQASAQAQQKGITLNFDQPAEPIRLLADRPKLNEIMANYIENAIRYSEDRTTITISLRQEADKVHFEVCDQGIGVPKAERKDLFTKFYRATNARHEHPNGNGIGLFVVKTVAAEHGGDVYYQPLAKGSLFGFWLPIG